MIFLKGNKNFLNFFSTFRKFYRRAEGFNLDVGSFVKALQYATDAEVVIIGKPTKSFFMSAVEDMKLQTDEVFFSET